MTDRTAATFAAFAASMMGDRPAAEAMPVAAATITRAAATIALAGAGRP